MGLRLAAAERQSNKQQLPKVVSSTVINWPKSWRVKSIGPSTVYVVSSTVFVKEIEKGVFSSGEGDVVEGGWTILGRLRCSCLSNWF